MKNFWERWKNKIFTSIDIKTTDHFVCWLCVFYLKLYDIWIYFNKRRRNILGGSFKNSNYLNDPNKIVYCIFVNLKFWCCHFKKSYGKGNIAINFQIFKMCRTFYAHKHTLRIRSWSTWYSHTYVIHLYKIRLIGS